MQFVVPQFIDVEPKIIGPITPRQFIISIIGLGAMFLSYKLTDFTLFVIEAILIFIITGTIAFLKVNGQPFHYFFLNIVQMFKRPNLRVWKKQILEEKIIVGKRVKGADKYDEKEEIIISKNKKELIHSRLSDLSLLVNTGGAYRLNINKPVNENNYE
ncbi:MAG: PrgI family protein [Candidatus Aenigmarchaeota archaeon]|nr:PrgI family protein [Candidatus Aenigmarchaeota archaeon]